MPIAVPAWLTGLLVLSPFPNWLPGLHYLDRLREALCLDSIPKQYLPLAGVLTVFFFLLWLFQVFLPWMRRRPLRRQERRRAAMEIDE